MFLFVFDFPDSHGIGSKSLMWCSKVLGGRRRDGGGGVPGLHAACARPVGPASAKYRSRRILFIASPAVTDTGARLPDARRPSAPPSTPQPPARVETGHLQTHQTLPSFILHLHNTHRDQLAGPIVRDKEIPSALLLRLETECPSSSRGVFSPHIPPVNRRD